MNKLIQVVALLAVAGTVCQAIALGKIERPNLVPNDQEETANLAGRALVFKDFCIESRDDVKAFLSETVNGAAADTFEAIFRTANEVGDEVVSSHREQTKDTGEKLYNKIATNLNKIAPTDGQSSDDEADLSFWGLIGESVKVAAGAARDTVKSHVANKVEQLKEQLNPEAIKGSITDLCSMVSYDLSKRLENKLAAAKKAIRADPEKSANKDVMNTVNRASLNSIKCVTSKRVAKVIRMCDALKVIMPELYNLVMPDEGEDLDLE